MSILEVMWPPREGLSAHLALSWTSGGCLRAPCTGSGCLSLTFFAALGSFVSSWGSLLASLWDTIKSPHIGIHLMLQSMVPIQLKTPRRFGSTQPFHFCGSRPTWVHPLCLADLARADSVSGPFGPVCTSPCDLNPCPHTFKITIKTNIQQHVDPIL